MTIKTAINEAEINQPALAKALESAAEKPSEMHEVATREAEVEPSGASDRKLSAFDRLLAGMRAYLSDERGMSTIEYALGCVAAAALGALLYTVVTSDTVEQALSGIFEKALPQGGRK